MMVTNEDIQEILRLLDDTAYDELHLQTGKFSISLKRSGQGGWTREAQTRTEPSVTELAGQEHAGVTPAHQGGGKEDAAPAADGLEVIRSPMVGTYYQAPKPGAEPFVTVGSQVQPDTVIAIIEVMKLMNSIRAGVTGEIVEILAADAQFVEQGQLLMRVKPAGA